MPDPRSANADAVRSGTRIIDGNLRTVACLTAERGDRVLVFGSFHTAAAACRCCRAMPDPRSANADAVRSGTRIIDGNLRTVACLT
ncbi:hypothetical protein C7E25_23255, partial [Stenotrophomonas maltophilia]